MGWPSQLVPVFCDFFFFFIFLLIIVTKNSTYPHHFSFRLAVFYLDITYTAEGWRKHPHHSGNRIMVLSQQERTAWSIGHFDRGQEERATENPIMFSTITVFSVTSKVVDMPRGNSKASIQYITKQSMFSWAIMVNCFFCLCYFFLEAQL